MIAPYKNKPHEIFGCFLNDSLIIYFVSNFEFLKYKLFNVKYNAIKNTKFPKNIDNATGIKLKPDNIGKIKNISTVKSHKLM